MNKVICCPSLFHVVACGIVRVRVTDDWEILILFCKLFLTCGFWPRVRARALRAPVFLGSIKAICCPFAKDNDDEVNDL